MNTATLPANTRDYPFTSRYFDVPQGTLHYVDEGEGEVLLFVHGTPTWSFLWRRYIQQLRSNYRCIAIDHLGFGLSDKPADFAGTPKLHSEHLRMLLDHLGVERYTLVVHDFGGPIGLGAALQAPHQVQRMVLFNTWCWSLAQEKRIRRADWLVRSALGKFLFVKTQFDVNVLLKSTFADKKNLSPTAHAHYRLPFPSAADRRGLWTIAKSLLQGADYFQHLHDQLHLLRQTPTLILWGTKDPFFDGKQLAKWKTLLPQAGCLELPVGHFVQEEAFAESSAALEDFLG